jgi:membrane protein
MSSRRADGGIRGALDRRQRRHAAAAFLVAVVRKFLDDRASRLAALIAYYAFFSLFPLLLVFVSVLGFVLEGDPDLRADVLDSALARIPVIGAQLADDVDPLTGSTAALVIGLVGALWAGLGVTVALGNAFEEIWDVPRLERRGALRARARGLVVLVALGTALIAATAIAALSIGGGIGPAAQRLGALAVSLAANAAIYLAGFWLLTPRGRRVADLLPGVAVAAVGSLLLQSAGGWYVDQTVNRASDTYGTFAVVIGLMSWFFVLAHLILFAAEINVVRARRLWPRSLTGALEPADRVALRRSAEAARRDERQEILVRFSDDGDAPGVPATPSSHWTASLPSARGDRRIRQDLDLPTRSAHMSTLVAIAYPDKGTAEQARQELIQATKEHLLRLEDAVIVEHGPDGKIKLNQAMSTTGAGAAGGALWGGLIGLIFLAPLFGMAVGAASGALAGKASDVGVDDNFMKELGNKLQPGSAALIALGSTDARDKLIERLRPYGGEIVQTSLGTEEEEQLKAAMGQQGTTA